MSAVPGALLTSFRVTCFVAAAFSGLNACLVLASLGLADRAPVSEQAVIVSIIVAIAFFSAGWLVLRISSQVSNLCLQVPPEFSRSVLATHLRGLLISLLTAVLVFAVITGLMTVGIVSRIGEGFAVFG